MTGLLDSGLRWEMLAGEVWWRLMPRTEMDRR
jgi:hypothetical protein